MRKSTTKLAYYDFNKVLSYNAVYNFIVGARGLGKTYGAKRHAIKKAIRNGEQFIYLRRYKEELKNSRPTFFADIEHEFPDHDFRVNGHVAEMAHINTRDDKKRKWQTIGYFMQLSNAQAQKSVAFPMVTTILFDEFIIEKGMLHYLPNEAKAFNDFYSTVDRWKDKTRVFFLANALTITNPYFLEYDILPSNEVADEFIVKGNGFIVAHFADSAEFSTGVFTTRFGQFIKDTDYADYAVASNFHDNNDNLIQLKNSEARYHCTIESKLGVFSVWIDWKMNQFYIQEKRPKQEIYYVLDAHRVAEGKALLNYSDRIMQYLRAAFGQGRVFFDTPKARNAFVQVFQR